MQDLAMGNLALHAARRDRIGTDFDFPRTGR